MVRTREEETEKLKYAGKLWYIGTKEDSSNHFFYL